MHIPFDLFSSVWVGGGGGRGGGGEGENTLLVTSSHKHLADKNVPSSFFFSSAGEKTRHEVEINNTLFN